MRQPASLLILTALPLCGSALVLAAGQPALGNDLKATITLQGQPCDQIVSSQRKADSDYVATCKDGNRYHVFVNTQGRVVVQKQ
jgi:uncharacterized protein YfaS (alpha-2-macroglobulin family)